MFIFITCLLSQFQPASEGHQTPEQYFAQCVEYKKVLVKLREADMERFVSMQGPPRNPVQKKKLRDEIKKRTENIKEFIEDKTQLQNSPIYPTELKIGQVGVLENFGDRNYPLTAIQVINANSVLCRMGSKPFLIRNIDTSDIVDDQVFNLTTILAVSGKYSYTSLDGAKNTVFALEPWEHENKWAEHRKKLIESSVTAAEKEAAKAIEEKKAKSSKPKPKT